MTDTTAADRAYANAEALIAGAKAGGEEALDFDREDTHALTTLPPQIADLTDLRNLDLDNTQVTDLTPLQALTALETLGLNNTQVTDFTPLQALPALETLGLNNTPVTDLTPLQALTALETLRLNNTQITDLTPLQALPALETLRLANTPVTDLTPLQALPALKTLGLDNTPVTDLTPLQALSALETLWLDNTQVTDLTPLQALPALKTLGLNNTPVTDFTPLQALPALKTLWLDNTPALDLRPVRDVARKVAERGSWLAVNIKGTKAAQADPEIGRIAGIEDGEERITRLIAHLEDWVPPGDSADAPPADSVLSVIPDGDRLEIPASTPSEAERDERLKQVLYDQLQDKASGLAAASGNRFYRLNGRARALADLVACPFGDADLLRIHLAVEDLRSYVTLGREEEDGEAFPPEVLVPLEDVLRLGPGLTLGHKDVDILIERANRRRAADPVPEAEIAAQNAMSEALVCATDEVGDRLRKLEETVAASTSEEAKEAQKAANRNVLWKTAVVSGAVSYAGSTALEATHGVVVDGLKTSITQLVTVHGPVLWQAALTYGAQFANWFSLSVAQLPDLTAEARAMWQRFRTGKSD